MILGARRTIQCGAVTITAMALAACGQTTSETSSSSDSETSETSIFITTSVFSAPWMVGVEKGIFVEHGLDVELTTVDTGSGLTQALASGDADFVPGGFGVILPPLDQGLPLKVVASAMGDATQQYDKQLAIVAGDGSGINDVEDLAGKKIGLVIAGTTNQYLDATLARHGISLDAIEKIQVDPGSTAPALSEGRIDAAVTWEPYGTILLNDVPGAQLVQRGGGYLSYNSTVATTAEMIEKDPDKVQRLVDAWAEAAQYVRNNPAETGEIVTHWISGLDAEVAAEAQEYVPSDPRISAGWMEAFATEMERLVENETLSGEIDVEDVVDPTFLTNTVESHPELFNDLDEVELYSK